MRKLDFAAFTRGREAYVRGMSVYDVAQKSVGDYQRAFGPDVDHDAVEAESKSFILGFVEGALADLRKVAGSARGPGIRA